MKSTLILLTVVIAAISVSRAQVVTNGIGQVVRAANAQPGVNGQAPNGQVNNNNGQYNPYAPPPGGLPSLTNNVPGFNNPLPGGPGAGNRFLNPPGRPIGVSNVPPNMQNQLVTPNNGQPNNNFNGQPNNGQPNNNFNGQPNNNQPNNNQPNNNNNFNGQPNNLPPAGNAPGNVPSQNQNQNQPFRPLPPANPAVPQAPR
jgi:hypothetical protein